MRTQFKQNLLAALIAGMLLPVAAQAAEADLLKRIEALAQQNERLAQQLEELKGQVKANEAKASKAVAPAVAETPKVDTAALDDLKGQVKKLEDKSLGKWLTVGGDYHFRYDYLKGEGAGISFLSTLDVAQRELSDAGTPQGDDYLLRVDNPLVVPVNQKIRLITTASDVIHAWMVPAFAVKQDAIPGFVRDTWFKAEKTGDFYGQCAELCGKEHAYMPIHVKVLSQEDYAKWADGEKKKMAAKADDPSKVWTQPDLIARGEKVYAANCAVCHRPDGKGAGPIKPLDGSPVVLDADRAKQVAVLLNGQNNGAMPAWKQLSDTEIAAVITYTKNSWGNKTGQLVQPAEIVAARK